MSKLLLKILNGLHSGSEVMLDDGAYSIGSGNEDDIQFKDASLNSGHAFLRIAEGRAEIKASSGEILFANGLTCDPGDEKWAPISPLQVLTIGTTRITFGPVGANWNTIVEDEGFRKDVQPGGADRETLSGQTDKTPIGQRPPLEIAAEIARGLGEKLRGHMPTSRLAMSAVLLGGVAVIALTIGLISSSGTGPRDFADEMKRVERAVESLPFSSKIKVAQEADGQIFVRGIIADNAERRAVVNSLEATHVPVKMRLATSQNIMMDVNNLIQAENVQIKATLNVDGTLILTGIILDPTKAKRISDLIAEQVSGPVAFNTTGIKDGNDLLRDVTRSARSAEVGTSVAFALVDNRMIEATGTLPYERANSWINFLQDYSENFAPRVPLRSLVQVVVPEGGPQPPPQISSQPIMLGASASNDERVLDMGKLTSGNLTIADVFVSKPPVVNNARGTTTAAETGTNAAGTTAARNAASITDPRRPGQVENTQAGATGAGSNTTSPRIATRDAFPPTPVDKLISASDLKTLLEAKPGQNLPAPNELNAPASRNVVAADGSSNGSTAAGVANAGSANAFAPNTLIDRWASGSLPVLTGKKEQQLVSALDKLGRQNVNGQNEAQLSAARSQTELAKITRDLLARDLRFTARNDADCTADWLRDPTLLPNLVFWLDILSFSDSLSLTSFDKPMQIKLAQAMLNPYALRRCLALIEPQGLPTYFEQSAFIPEIIVNPAFIKFLARDVTNTTFDVVGANLTKDRYVISSDGKRYRNGASIDLYSKIIDIGELGILIELSDRVEIVALDRQLLWSIRRMSEIGN